MTESLWIVIMSAIFVNNIVLAKFLGLCPFFGVSKKTSTALSMGLAVMFVMTAASIVTWLLDRYILAVFDIQFLQTVTFILVIASFVQFVELYLRKFMPGLHSALGIFLPLITTNCAIMGVALLNIQNEYSFITSIVFGLASGVGFTIALLLMSGIRERLDISEVPFAMKGVAIAFIVAALLAMVFIGGFGGMI